MASSVAGKALTPEQNERIKKVIRTLYDSERWNQTQLGERLGIDQTTVSMLLDPRSHRGTSIHVAILAAKLANEDINEMLGISGTPEADAPLPMMEPAIRIARARKYSEEFLQQFIAEPHRLGDRYNEGDWLVEIEHAHLTWSLDHGHRK